MKPTKSGFKSALRRTVRDVLLLAAVLGILISGGLLISERRQAAASDFTLPTLPPEAGEAEPRVDFESLRRQAPMAIAWITIPGTQVDYPVVQWTDNQHYLDLTAKGEVSRYGAIFMDYRNSADFSDFYTLVYGHNMRDGRMFGSLRQFREDDFWDRVKTGTLRTPERTYRLQIFGYATVYATSEYYANIAFFMPGEKEKFLGMLKSTAVRWRDIPLDPGKDHILALSTCIGQSEDARLVLLAKIEG